VKSIFKLTAQFTAKQGYSKSLTKRPNPMTQQIQNNPEKQQIAEKIH
jgi:hypothetical protein